MKWKKCLKNNRSEEALKRNQEYREVEVEVTYVSSTMVPMSVASPVRITTAKHPPSTTEYKCKSEDKVTWT